jgi:hypothetical protein
MPSQWEELRKQDLPGAPRIDDDEFCGVTPKGDYELDDAAVFQGGPGKTQRIYHAAAVFRPDQATSFIKAIEANARCKDWVSPVDGSRATIASAKRISLAEEALQITVLSPLPNPSVDFIYFRRGAIAAVVAYSFAQRPDSKFTMLYAQQAERKLARLCAEGRLGANCN